SCTQASSSFWATLRVEKICPPQELLAKRPVETLDLARRGGRRRGGQAMRDAVLPADLVEEDLGGSETESGREDLAVVGEDLFGHPVALEGLGEESTDRPGR